MNELSFEKVRDLLRRARSLSVEDGDRLIREALNPSGQDDLERDSPAPGDFVFLQPGSIMGPYTLCESLGEGGMGKVFLARREHDVSPLAAIKILRSFDADFLTRFNRESNILASLHHPQIAGYLDRGQTNGGLPYLVMEYVRGETIDTWCDQRNLDLDSRIDLFLKVCEAVAHAHQNLVIHRDIKPSNVLVTSTGDPKLLDFGISGMLDPDTGSQRTMTMGDQRMFTPEYASPELVRGERLTASSDVYAMGVLLHRLLTGLLPYRFPSQAFHDICRVVCTQEPQLPSGLATGDHSRETRKAHLERIAGERNLLPRELKRKLRGDLDRIILKAIEKNSNQRYPSIEALAEDLRRFRQGRPIRDAPRAWGYRSRKFLWRNRLGVALAGVFFLLITAFALSSHYQLAQTRYQQELTQQERALAEKVTSFMMDLYDIDESEQAGLETISAKTLLDRGADRIRNQLTDEPRVQGRMMITLGALYRKLGVYARAESLLSEGHGLLAEHSTSNGDMVAALSELAALRHSQGQYSHALTYYHQALARVPEDAQDKRINLLRGLSENLLSMDSLDECNTYLLELERLVADNYGNQSPAMANVWRLRARYLNDMGFWKQGREKIEEALTLLRGRTEYETDYASCLVSMSEYLHQEGDYGLCGQYLKEALEIRRRLFGETHPVYVENLIRIAHNMGFMKDYEGASELYEQIIDSKRRAGDTPGLMAGIRTYARVRLRMGLFEEAEALFLEALAISKRSYGDVHSSVKACYNDLTIFYLQTRNLERAKALGLKNLALARKVAPGSVPGAQNLVGNVYLERGEYDNARTHLETAIPRLVEMWGEDSFRLAKPFNNLGRLYYHLGDLDKAEVYLEKSVHAFRDKDDVWRLRAQDLLKKIGDDKAPR